MGKKMLFVTLALFLATTFSFTAMPTPSVADETLKIGSIWGLSGPMSQLGVVCRNGAMLAVDWINGKGGVNVKGKKYKIQLVVEDNKNTAPGSVNAATKLVHKDKLKFITGMNIPFQAEAVQTVTEPAKVILNVAKTGNLLAKNRYSFTSTPGFTAPIPHLYDFLRKTYPDAKSVSFIVNDESGALVTGKICRAVAEAHGYKLFETNLVQFGTKEYYPTWTKVMKDKPDIVDMAISAPDDLATRARQGREIGFKGPIVTCNTADPDVYIHLLGKDLATDFVYAGYDPLGADTPAMVKTIAKLWTQKYKQPFSLDAVDGFSSVWTLVQAIEKAQSLEPEAVVAAWEKMDTIETPTGTGKMGGFKAFGINHMVLGPSPVTLIKNGKVETTHWYPPADL